MQVFFFRVCKEAFAKVALSLELSVPSLRPSLSKPTSRTVDEPQMWTLYPYELN